MNLDWDGDQLVRLVVRGAIVHGAVIDDPLLGPAHRIETRRGDTTMSALDWRRPTTIPAVANPAVLAGGTGTALLDAIARLALAAGVPALRYAGPYPTPALFRSLARSFRTTASEDEFTADLLPRAARLARDPIPIDFTPAPSDALALPGGHVAFRRDGVIERAVIGGVAFERGTGVARLVGDPAAAELWIGDAPYARIATLTADGTAFLAGPTPVPPSTSPVIGQTFPLPLAAALAELVAGVVPSPLHDAARMYLIARPLVWADLGAQLARALPEATLVHAALWDRIAPLGLARLALALAEALAPTITNALIAALMVPPPPAS